MVDRVKDFLVFFGTIRRDAYRCRIGAISFDIVLTGDRGKGPWDSRWRAYRRCWAYSPWKIH